ncbi:MAG: hypothetical protein M1827_002172 [Pycnora praestabilis]|nr:MAG: hypothetical protein M1827_002172 [Pycnora praestabilis]
MTRPTTPHILTELRNPSSISTQLAALKALKNEIIGHEQKKQMWIGLGAVVPIVRILTLAKGNGKRRSREANGATGRGEHVIDHVDEDEARLQATIIVGSLAHGGPAYLTPLHAANTIPLLLGALMPDEHSSRLLLATLRTLSIIADASLLEYPGTGATDSPLANLLYSKTHIESLAQILAQTSPSSIVQQQISTAAVLIAKTCREEWHRTALMKAGILGNLITKLAGFVMSMGFVLPAAAASMSNPPSVEPLPAPASPKAKLAPILEAIGVIIQDSKLRASQLILSSSIVSVLPTTNPEMISDYAYISRATFDSSHPHSRQALLNPMELFLPRTPSQQPKASSTQSAAFPPLGEFGPLGRHTRTVSAPNWTPEQTTSETKSSGDDYESPLMAWLLYLTRAEKGCTRLMAAWVLTLLYRAGLCSKRRESTLALLLVPLLVRMLDEDFLIIENSPKVSNHTTFQDSGLTVRARASFVLAMLVMDSPELQRAAVDAHAITKLSLLLKKSYDPLPASSQSSLWTATAIEATSLDCLDGPSASRLGQSGLSHGEINVLTSREGVLKALAAIAPFKDEYRKAIIESGVVPLITESLKPYHSNSPSGPDGGRNGASRSGRNTANPSTLSGNPIPILIAACNAARALSRSVNILRTSLIDAGVARPLFALLSHSDMDVQIAATAVVCNLVLEFSPMREAIIDEGVLGILCEQAHSTNAKLRLNAVWALKHLVSSAPNEIKMSCFEELGKDWLIQLVCDDTEDSALASMGRGDDDMGAGTPIGMGTPNAAGERVDILNAIEEPRDTALHDDEYDEDTVSMADSIGALSRPQPVFLAGKDGRNTSRPSSSRANPSDMDKGRLAAMKETDLYPIRQARRDDTAIQEQGLDFMRNLICGQGAPEMIDFLLEKLGQKKVFDILCAKLRPKTINAFNREKRHPNFYGNETRTIQPQPEIIISVCYILVHLAAGQPRHRQLLISQTDLLRLLVPLFNHAHRTVRASCAWIIINLTWIDDTSDQMNCKARAIELRNLGIEQRLQSLEHDPELDVKERTKTALHQLGDLLR